MESSAKLPSPTRAVCAASLVIVPLIVEVLTPAFSKTCPSCITRVRPEPPSWRVQLSSRKRVPSIRSNASQTLSWTCSNVFSIRTRRISLVTIIYLLNKFVIDQNLAGRRAVLVDEINQALHVIYRRTGQDTVA